ncbi:MAG: hypothetical protein ACFB2Z_08350 [Maricaulaceae bacterium]
MSTPTDPPADLDEPDPETLSRLWRARAFAQAIDEVRPFERFGEPLSDTETAWGRAYLDGLGFPDTWPAVATDWLDAVEAAYSLDVDAPGWEAEEQLRAGLTEEVMASLDPDGVSAVLTVIADKAASRARDAMAEARDQFDLDDETAMTAAVGALVRSAHNAALVVLAGRDQERPPHPLLCSWRLFASGRWVVGLIGSTLTLL